MLSVYLLLRVLLFSTKLNLNPPTTMLTPQPPQNRQNPRDFFIPSEKEEEESEERRRNLSELGTDSESAIFDPYDKIQRARFREYFKGAQKTEGYESAMLLAGM